MLLESLNNGLPDFCSPDSSIESGAYRRLLNKTLKGVDLRAHSVLPKIRGHRGAPDGCCVGEDSKPTRTMEPRSAFVLIFTGAFNRLARRTTIERPKPKPRFAMPAAPWPP